MSSSTVHVNAPPRVQFSRQLGDSELSYYLPSRADGVNDMYLHLGFRAPANLVSPQRVHAAWGILRGRHPLLASRVVIQQGKYDDVRFVYTPPSSPQDALEDARNNLELKESTKDGLIDAYLNGPRTLSNDRVSYLFLSSPAAAPITPPATPEAAVVDFLASGTAVDPVKDFDLLICAAHFLGDGMALHTFANDLFGLLAGPKEGDGNGEPASDAKLGALLEKEWTDRWGPTQTTDTEAALPASLESRLPPALSTFQRAACEIEFKCSQDRLIGGHSFARAAHGERRTIVPTVSFDAHTTKQVLKKCKSEGVSIAHALFAVCNIAWARLGSGREELPMMMYSALNLRPYLSPSPSNASYWFLAVGYFNVVLPAFLPSSTDADAISKTFWHRARTAKIQSASAAKTPMLVPRTRCMAVERGTRSRRFALQDDLLALGDRLPPTPGATPPPATQPSARASKAPSAALLGLSLLGNLDGMYKHAAYPRVALHTLTTGSRQRPGGMLLFGYTFAGRLWLSLGYDENGYEKEQVRKWWDGVLAGVHEFLAV